MEHIEQLRSIFVPAVENVMPKQKGKNSIKCDVVFVEMMPVTKGIRYTLTVELIGNFLFDDLANIQQALDQFCSYEESSVKIGKYNFALGDGYDGQAVFFENGKYGIWLRGWED